MNEWQVSGSGKRSVNGRVWVFTAVERVIATWTIFAAHRVDCVHETHCLGGARLYRWLRPRPTPAPIIPRSARTERYTWTQDNDERHDGGNGHQPQAPTPGERQGERGA